LPWGFLIGLDLAARRRAAGRVILLGGVTALGASLAVEFLQLFSTARTTSATDLFTNTAGGLVGAALGWVAGTRYRVALGPWLRDRIRRDPWSVLVGAIAAGALLWALAPFDVTLDVGDVKGSLKSLRPLPFGPPLRGETPPLDVPKMLASVLAWIPIGGVFALAARNGRLSLRALGGALIGLAVSVEGVQLLITSHATDATSVLLFCVGGAAGWGAVSARPGVTARAWTGPGLAVWTAATAVAGLSPWRFASPDLAAYGPERFVPFIYYFLRTDVYALGDAVVQILLYLPLGLLARRRAVLVGAVVAALVEGGQLFAVGRVADVTDVALGALGAGAGTWLVRRGLAIRDSQRTAAS
jgi:glycopeptide antibiotics resistance protein